MIEIKVVFPYPAPYGHVPDIYEYVENLRGLGVEAHYLGWKPQESRFQFLKKLAIEIEKINPNIVHVFHFRSCGLLPVLLTRRKMKWILDVRTVHVENKNLQPERLVGLKTRLTWIESLFYDRVLVLTPVIKSYMQPNIHPISIIPLGGSGKLKELMTDENKKRIRDSLRIPMSSKVILYSGSHSPSRKIDELLKAFAGLSNLRETYLLMVGGIRSVDFNREQLIFKKYIELCQHLNIQDRVIFLGHKPYSEALVYYSAADIGVAYLPQNTPYILQPPTKLIEFMMAGLLAVGNDIPSIREFIRDGETGILCGNGVEGLRDGLERALSMLRDKEILFSIRERAYAEVECRTWDKIVKNYILPVYSEW